MQNICQSGVEQTCFVRSFPREFDARDRPVRQCYFQCLAVEMCRLFTCPADLSRFVRPGFVIEAPLENVVHSTALDAYLAPARPFHELPEYARIDPVNNIPLDGEGSVNRFGGNNRRLAETENKTCGNENGQVKPGPVGQQYDISSNFTVNVFFILNSKF